MALAFKTFIPGFRLTDNTLFNQLFTGLMSFAPNLTTGTVISGATLDNTVVGGTTPVAGSFTNLTMNGLYVEKPQLLTAAGATQGNAAAITKSMAIINVSTTASTHGVKLPTAATGLQVMVANLGTYGVKIYPATNGKIGAASTNSADSTVLAINKSNTYIALNTTLWVVARGA